MEVEILKETDRKIIFNLFGVDRRQANYFRKILLADIPTVAPDKVYISENNSYFADDILAERVSKLILIDVEPGDRFKLNISNTKKDFPEGRLILSNDFKTKSKKGSLFPDLLFLKFPPTDTAQQRVILEFDTRRGTSTEHKKFSPVTTVVALRNYRTSKGELVNEREVHLHKLEKQVSEDDSYYFSVGLTGAMIGEDILNTALEIFDKNKPKRSEE